MIGHIHKPGDILVGRYRIEEYLDEGGMQQVFFSTDNAFDRPVVVKVPKNPSAVKRFARSAQVSARINHANVAKTLDYFEQDGRSYLVEEYLPGSDLRQALRKNYVLLDSHLVAHIMHHIAKGLAASHHAGVFHRDLKPSNIMVSDDPGFLVVKITDFGIAKMAEEEIADGLKSDESITGSQTLVGALPYMAPEMIDRPREADQPADIWAIGAMAYQLITGTLPFGSGLPAVPKILAAVLPEKPEVLTRRVQFRSLGNEIWEIVSACLNSDPTKRPSADDLVAQCSALCYSVAKREIGTISRYADDAGAWGFIVSPGRESVFFHRSAFYSGGERAKVGQRVNFAAFPGSPKQRAFPVLLLKDE